MIQNWLVRGDTHGQFAWMNNGCLDNYKPEETAIIILGDAGFNYYLNKYDDRKKAEVNAPTHMKPACPRLNSPRLPTVTLSETARIM